MASITAKFYGVIDLTTAALLYFTAIPVPDVIKTLIILVMVIKGVPSLFA